MYKIVVEIPEGWGGGVILLVKKWKFRGGGGAYVKFPPWWGYGYFMELHNTTKFSWPVGGHINRVPLYGPLHNPALPQ